MRTIAINLGDNDFASTFYNLLETLNRAIEWNCEEMTRPQIVNCILSGIEHHYVTFQQGYNQGSRGYGPVPATVKYLLDNITILFDEEAEEDIENNFHNGEAWYLEIQTGKVYSY